MSVEAYEVRQRKDKRGVNLISDALLFGRLWYGEPDAISNAVDYAKFRSRSVWRRMKKGHIKVRDLQPEKGVKGGGGVTGNSKPITGGARSTGHHCRH